MRRTPACWRPSATAWKSTYRNPVALSPKTAKKTYKTVCEELDRRRHVTLGLERVEELLHALGDPQRHIRAVQVVGTNGKGTTAVALARALELAGHPAGAYLSPHVHSYTERVMLRGESVSEGTFAAAMGEALDIADEAGIPASQFELLTAGALKAFRDAGLSWAVLEAGLGARYDATSASRAEAVVLTNVGLDHTEYLGPSVEEIAREKLASLASGGLLVLGSEDPGVVEVAREESERAGVRRLVWPALGPDVPGRLHGLAPYAARNVALGVRAAEELLGERFEEEVWERVAGESRLPARFEVHEVRGVPVVVDGGHNPPGLEAALAGMKSLYGDRPLGVVFGCLRDKDIRSMLSALKREAHAITLTTAADERAAEPGWVSREFGPRDRGGRSAGVASSASEALDRAVEEMREVGGVVLVTGSLYTATAVLPGLRREQE